MKPTEWLAYATAANDTATASKAAVAGKRHTAAVVIASYDDPTDGGTLTITVTLNGTSTAIVHYIHGADVVPLEIRGDVNTLISAALTAGASAGSNYVTIAGHTTG